MADLTTYQYYGLVGQTAAQVGAQLSTGLARQTAGDVSASGLTTAAAGFETTAEALELQAQMEIINADNLAAQRLEQFNETAARNTVTNIAMGRTGEGSAAIIQESNLEAAEQDIARIKRTGKVKSIQAKGAAVGAKSKKSAALSAAQQAKISGKAAFGQSVLSSVSSLATAGAQLSK